MHEDLFDQNEITYLADAPPPPTGKAVGAPTPMHQPPPAYGGSGPSNTTSTAASVSVSDAGYTFSIYLGGQIKVTAGPANVGRVYQPGDAAYPAVLGNLLRSSPQNAATIKSILPDSILDKASVQGNQTPARDRGNSSDEGPGFLGSILGSSWLLPVVGVSALGAVAFIFYARRQASEPTPPVPAMANGKRRKKRR